MDGTGILELFTIAPSRAGLWLALSFLLAGATTVATRLAAPELERPVRIVRWVQVPYLGLLLGGLSPRFMGLSKLDWASGLFVGVVLLSGLLFLLVLIRISLHSDRDVQNVFTRGSTASPFLLIENSAQEFHWCFLRGAVWELLLSNLSASQSSGYWAVWIAAALALPGIAIHPKAASERVLTTFTLATTSVIFVLTRNFWLCLILHLGLRMILRWREPSQHQAA